MPTETTNNRLKSGYIVQSALSEFRVRVVPKLPDPMPQQPILEGVPTLDNDGLLDFLSTNLTKACDQLFEKDVGWVTELTGDRVFLLERDKLTGEIRDVMIRARSMFEGCYKPPRIEPFGFPRRVSQEAELLLQEARHLDLRLHDDLVLPQALHPELTIDPKVLAKPLTPKVGELEAVLKTVRDERRKAQIARLERNEAIDNFNLVFTLVTRTAESLFNWAGEKELADRVRPSLTRPGRTARDPDEIFAETGQTPPDFGPIDPLPIDVDNENPVEPDETPADAPGPSGSEGASTGSEAPASDEPFPQKDAGDTAVA